MWSGKTSFVVKIVIDGIDTLTRRVPGDFE